MGTILLGEMPRLGPLGVAAGVAFLTLSFGWLIFHRAEFRFAEVA